MVKYPNWLEIPEELMANILQRLGTKEILEKAWKVCTTWRKVCRNPEMWKVIVMHKELSVWKEDCHFERLTKQAVDLSCGEVIGVGIKGFGTDELLDHILLSSCKLKQLYLWSCSNITGSGLIRAVKSLPQLEELGISYISINPEDLKVIGQSCPQLKTFIMFGGLRRAFSNSDDKAFAIANNMPELRCLKLSDKSLTNIGLKAILDGCPHLEILHIHMRYNHDLDGSLRKLCMERIKDFKFHPEDEDDNDYDYTPSAQDLDDFSDD